MFHYGRLALVAIFVGVAVLYWPAHSKAYNPGPLDIMPAIYTGGALTEFGLHYDEVGSADFGAYDYSASVGTNTWLRGMAEGDQFYQTRYKYWKETDCSVTGRLQLYIGGFWYDYWQYDLHLVHITPNVPYVSYTQAVTYTGDWLYVVVGTVRAPSECPPNTGSHVHLGGYNYGSGWLTWAPKDNDTCWSDSTQCNTVMSMWKRLHSTCSSWNGWTQQRSGTKSQYYCETWSAMSRTDSTPAFKKP